jgi:hypothetical protein
LHCSFCNFQNEIKYKFLNICSCCLISHKDLRRRNSTLSWATSPSTVCNPAIPARYTAAELSHTADESRRTAVESPDQVHPLKKYGKLPEGHNWITILPGRSLKTMVPAGESSRQGQVQELWNIAETLLQTAR